MKKIITLLSLSLSLGALAQERVLLNSEEISVDSTEAILVRTAETPNNVRVTFQVQIETAVCERYETRPMLITSSAQCGQDRYMTTVMSPGGCARYNPRNYQCQMSPGRYQQIVSYRPRSCHVPESFCAEYGKIVRTDSDSVKIKFRGLPALGGTEEDTFLVIAGQKNYDDPNVTYDIKPLATKTKYMVSSRGLFGVDSYVIKEE